MTEAGCSEEGASTEGITSSCGDWSDQVADFRFTFGIIKRVLLIHLDLNQESCAGPQRAVLLVLTTGVVTFRARSRFNHVRSFGLVTFGEQDDAGAVVGSSTVFVCAVFPDMYVFCYEQRSFCFRCGNGEGRVCDLALQQSVNQLPYLRIS